MLIRSYLYRRNQPIRLPKNGLIVLIRAQLNARVTFYTHALIEANQNACINFVG